MARLRISEFALIYGTSRQQLGQLLERNDISPDLLENPEAFYAELLAKTRRGGLRNKLAMPEDRKKIEDRLKRWLD